MIRPLIIISIAISKLFLHTGQCKSHENEMLPIPRPQMVSIQDNLNEHEEGIWLECSVQHCKSLKNADK